MALNKIEISLNCKVTIVLLQSKFCIIYTQHKHSYLFDMISSTIWYPVLIFRAEQVIAKPRQLDCSAGVCNVYIALLTKLSCLSSVNNTVKNS